jgi:integrase/recombinase XerD
MATLYKRGRVWYSYLKMGGKKVRKALSSDRRIAEGKLADLIKLRNATKHGHAPTDMSLAEFRKRYIAGRKTEQKSNTWESDDRALGWLEESCAAHRISQMTPGMLEHVRSEWMKNRLNKKTKKPKVYVINRDLRSIKTAMYWAERQGYLPKQEWAQVKEIKTPKGRLHFFTVQDLAKLKEKCRGIWLTMLYLGARAGLRPAEMYWLEWSDVDFERNRIHIAPKKDWTPKDFQRRWIPMPKDLREHLKQRAIGRTETRVLSDGGHIPTTDSMTVYFTRLARKAGLTGTPYTLRHTYASHYVQNGGSIYRLKEYMGHSSVEATQIYAHLAPADADKTLEMMPGIL